MKLNKLVLAMSLSLSSFGAFAYDCGCNGSTYDKKQDVKINANTSAIVGLTERNAQQDKDIHDTYVLANTKYTEAAGKALEGQVKDTRTDLSNLSGRVDSYAEQGKAAYDSLVKTDTETNSRIDGLQSQGEAAYKDLSGKTQTAQRTAEAAAGLAGGAMDLSVKNRDGLKLVNSRVDETNQHVSLVEKAAQAANEKADAGAVRMDGIEGSLAVTDQRSINNSGRLDKAEGAIRETNTQLEVTNKRSINNSKRLDGVETVNNKQDQQLKDHDGRITNNEQNITALDQSFSEYQVTNRQEMASGNARTLSQSKSYTNQKFGELKRQVDDNKKEARSGIAGVAAMANIPNVPSQTFSVGAGIGQYKDQTALAVGAHWNVSDRVTTKASLGFTNEDAVVGAGIAFGF